MTGICIPTSADIRIEVAGRRVAVVQSYRVEEEASCEVVGAIGSNEPVGVVRGPARYRITLQRVYATDEAISDGLRFHELRQFSLVIAKPDTMVVFSGCEWERLTERAEVGSSVLEEAVVLAAVRGEYEQQEGEHAVPQFYMAERAVLPAGDEPQAHGPARGAGRRLDAAGPRHGGADRDGRGRVLRRNCL